MVPAVEVSSTVTGPAALPMTVQRAEILVVAIDPVAAKEAAVCSTPETPSAA